MPKGIHETVVGGVLLIAAWRGLDLPTEQRLEGWELPGGGPATLVPDLRHDDALRLSWLPGVGAWRARQIVEQRPFLQVPLEPRRLSLLAGVGETTAIEVAAWYARKARTQGKEDPRVTLE